MGRLTCCVFAANLIDGFGAVLTPENLLLAAAGVTLGTLVGVLPGIGPALTVALLLPITFNFSDPVGAFILFAGIYAGGMYGGSTTSILLNTPGESSSVATAIEGYEMAKRGRAKAALATAAIGSFVAGHDRHRRAHADRRAGGRLRREVPRRGLLHAHAAGVRVGDGADVAVADPRLHVAGARAAARLRRDRPADRPVAADVRRRPARQRDRHRDRRGRAVRGRRGAAHGEQAARERRGGARASRRTSGRWLSRARLAALVEAVAARRRHRLPVRRAAGGRRRGADVPLLRHRAAADQASGRVRQGRDRGRRRARRRPTTRRSPARWCRC